MIAAESQQLKIKHAYQTLNVPRNASAKAIKQAYRRLLKRWHPDLYISGTPAHAEATQMSEYIIEAYSVIGSAPLRYLAEPCSTSTAKPVEPSPAENAALRRERGRLKKETAVTIARIEYAVRFVCGAGVGFLACLLFSFYLLADVHWDLAPLIPVAMGITVASGFLSARLGDQYWFLLLRRWWLEP